MRSLTGPAGSETAVRELTPGLGTAWSEDMSEWMSRETPTICDGLVVRWTRGEDDGRRMVPEVSASRNAVYVGDICCGSDESVEALIATIRQAQLRARSIARSNLGRYQFKDPRP